MRTLYLRCNSGHLFSTSACPFDGWGVQEFAMVRQAEQSLLEKGMSNSIQNFANLLPQSLLGRIIIMEFGSDA